MTQFKCPRRDEAPYNIHPRENDYDESDDTCHYCGSLNPDTFMSRVEAGTILLGATDKNYKVYVTALPGTEKFKQTYRECPRDVENEGLNGHKYFTRSCKGPDTCTHWVTRETDTTKFYFQHLSEDQKNRFIKLMNDPGKLKFEGNYKFYVLPFFVTRQAKA